MKNQPWTQDFVNKLRDQWKELTEQDIKDIHRDNSELTRKLQDRYGYQKDRAQREVDEYCKSCSSSEKIMQR